jgi:hypothetical protein
VDTQHSAVSDAHPVAFLSLDTAPAPVYQGRVIVADYDPSVQHSDIVADYDPSVQHSDSGQHFLVSQLPTAAPFEASPGSLRIIRPTDDIHIATSQPRSVMD